MANITKPIGLSNVWADGGTKIDPGAAKVNIGWVVQLPPYEFQNWIDNRQDRAIAHFSQHGVPEWDGATEYQGLLSYTQGSDGIIYKCVQTNINKDPSNALNDAYWARAFEDFGSVAAVQSQLNAHITNYQSLAGLGNVAGARTNLSVYSKVESDTRFASLNGSAAQVFAVGVATQPEHAVRLGQVGSLLQQATESNLGVVRLATTGATETGTDDLTAITPLKASNVYLKKSGNLSGMSNYATARANLGLGTAAVQNTAFFLQTANNLADLPSKPTARVNLGLTSTAIQPESYFLRSGLNLSDLPDKAGSRSNLGLTAMATADPSLFMYRANNLAELTNAGVARNNLGLADTATIGSGNLMFRGANLADVTNVQAARNNLGLSNAATITLGGIPAGTYFEMAQIVSTNGVMYLGAYKLQWGPFSIGTGKGNSVAVNFAVPIGTPLFYTTGVDNAATEQIGLTAITTGGMRVQKGTGDPEARTGRWFMLST